MTHKTRRIIFYSLVLIFVLVTPLIILYAVGYSFDWQKHILVQTGGIYLKSIPVAQIAVNGKKNSQTTRLISRLLPKSYEVSVTKDGFYPWQKTLEVSPRLVTEARNIFLFPKQPESLSVAKNVTSSIEYFLSSTQEIQKENQAQNIASTTAGWLSKNNSVFYISKTNYILYQTDLSGPNKQQISKEALPVQPSYKIISNDGRIFLALSPKGDLYRLNNDSGIFENLGSRIKNAQISNDNKIALYATDNEIWSLYLEDFLTQPYKKAGDKELITRYAQKITQAIFYPDSAHIAFVVNDKIKVTELDGRDQRNTVDLISAVQPQISQIYFDNKNNYLYYLTKNQLYRINLGY